jgi:hypothetical protein
MDPLGQTAHPHAAQPVSRLPSVPGLGTSVRVGRLSELPALPRVPRGQDGGASCRLVPCAKAAVGKREGPAGTQRGPASLTWAFAAAARLGLRTPPAGPPALARCAQPHGPGQGLTVWAPPLARARSALRQRAPGFARPPGRHGAGSGAGAPPAARDAPGLRLAAGALRSARRQHPRRSPEALWPCSLGRCWDSRSGSCAMARVAPGAWGRPRPRPGTSRAHARRCAATVPRTVCGHGAVARPQRSASLLLCTRPRDGDRASIRDSVKLNSPS